MKSRKKIYIGTSAWMHKDWAGMFYPKKLKEDQLTFYAREFDTVELNSSFYHLPPKKTFENWYKKTPAGFVFAVKVSQYITHQKRLMTDEHGVEAVGRLIENARGLKEKLGVFLIQLPPSAKANSERLNDFLKVFRKKLGRTKVGLAIEFRHESWMTPEVMKILKKYKTALVISSSPEIPLGVEFTADIAYIRFHGPLKLFSSKYNEKQMQAWAEKIRNFPPSVKKVYAYFNNDFKGYAIINARYLKKLISV